MFALVSRRLACPRGAAAAWLILSALTLAACQSETIPSRPEQAQATQPPIQPIPGAPVTQTPLPTPGGPGNKVRVALLLPLSGPNAVLGNAMLDAAQMALFDVADEKLELLPHDTQGTAEAATAAAQAAVSEGARLIIGPLIAAEVNAVKPVARAAGVPVVAFSTATQLAGDGTYLMGFLPRQEIERVVGFAHSRGVSRFAVIAPSTPYGDVAVEAMRAAVQANGDTLERVEIYDPNVQDLTPSVQHLVGATMDPAVRQKLLSKQSAAGKDAAAQLPDIVIPFDAILIPEGGNRLKSVAPLLPYYDVDPEKVHFLGTGLWDEPGLGTEPALNGGWYAAPPPGARADFDQRFRAVYKRPPPRLATLAYDATALAAVLARNPSGADFSAAALTNPSGFAGVDGIFRLRADGLIQRGLAVLEVHRNGNTVVSPAPTTFQAIGY
ncbi:MAG TPA: penicillin-binding protein activator [Stellaceae bacterium]|nr:penicillin-binding protein activator [Stellaceae bacterium]